MRIWNYYGKVCLLNTSYLNLFKPPSFLYSYGLPGNRPEMRH